MNKFLSGAARFLLICLLWHFQTVANAASPENSPAEIQQAVPEATLRFYNRDIVTFRGSLFGVSAQDRAKRSLFRLQEQLNLPGPYKITQKVEAAGVMLQINGATTFFITPEDAKRLQDESLESLSQRTAHALELAIAESQESRNLQSMLQALVKAALATLVAVLVVWGLSRARGAVAQRLTALIESRSENLHVAGVKLFRPKRLALIVQKTLKVLFQLLLFVIFYEWLSFVLASFPFTRAWGELLSQFLLGVTLQLGGAVASAIPGIFTAAVIFYIVSVIARVIDSLSERVRSGDIQVNWLDAELAEPTRRIVKAALWLFGLAMAYPYLPGAQTEAFKGLSVLLGLMITLGSSNLVGQAASGLILTYGRVFRKGEYVRIGEHEGTVTDLGMFSTRIRTGMGEEVNLANSMVLNASTKNYSRIVKGDGFILDTTVTIGYDTPWRQVYAMLEEAARRTEGVLADPYPQVFQTALSDWYPQYRLVCQAVPSEPRPRALLLSALHANIQDVFNEYGVQIMSPQYFSDPVEPKIVPQDKWFSAPARKPD